jgi:hypothetical protein
MACSISTAFKVIRFLGSIEGFGLDARPLAVPGYVPHTDCRGTCAVWQSTSGLIFAASERRTFQISGAADSGTKTRTWTGPKSGAGRCSSARAAHPCRRSSHAPSNAESNRLRARIWCKRASPPALHPRRQVLHETSRRIGCAVHGLWPEVPFNRTPVEPPAMALNRRNGRPSHVRTGGEPNA